ncbi:5-(carboxyamino)imidazole ribonucleotide mutase [Pseudoramibacter sp.]|jgi:5-(carboxyamino)imidazole ribonucleotide mutase|uniref:5-(carboxyamino)imidazole ribonucleotide mutase n=1 Tax=Pseudoramibacter sp. TaxID=2034862 RepID=UPI0025F2E5BE|nr:5-(carboxyamino)imidazole ribonucleotide mutase [Pseudoramibacter sp.]MCH4072117.1 5-(carboxyamino)imidazole ribonucleotide mutase [Pseudoramibacter sp.]MCH4105887.1 5-(carboxyamino)imidazole ribonucleotide mutase [Pseudoramibacter sp.]
MPKAAVIMGSDSDFDVVQKCLNALDEFNIDYDAKVISAHRTPHKAVKFAEDAEKNGYEVIITAAGKAAHLGGIMAGVSPLPVIGIPIKTSLEGGMDSLLSIVQMPSGVPVATVGVNGAENAGILAAEMLSIKYPDLREKIKAKKQAMAKQVEAKDQAIQAKVSK